MTGDKHLSRGLRRLLPHRSSPTKRTSPSLSFRNLAGSQPARNGEEHVRLSSLPSVKPGATPNESCSLWDEVYDAFIASTESTDLRDLAHLLRQECKSDSSLDTNLLSGAIEISKEWKICDQVLKLAETKRAESRKEAKSSTGEAIRYAYGEICNWVQKFVALGDVVAQIDPVHIGLPWAGIRAILIVSTESLAQYWR